MTTREIIKGLRQHLDEEMSKKGFKYIERWSSYQRLNQTEKIYFHVSFLLVDYAGKVGNKNSKYLELYVGIFDSKISELLHQVTARGKNLDSLFYFTVAGNMLSDIALNKVPCSYTNRNNHNYFKLQFDTERDIKSNAGKVLRLINGYALPFFQRLDTLEKIKIELDCCYDKDLAINNRTVERLLALVAMLFHFEDPLRDEKVKKIRDFFARIGHDEAIIELQALVELLA